MGHDVKPKEHQFLGFLLVPEIAAVLARQCVHEPEARVVHNANLDVILNCSATESCMYSTEDVNDAHPPIKRCIESLRPTY